MSEQVDTDVLERADERPTLRELGRTFRQHLPLLLVLVALWMLLWGTISPLSVVSGIVVAVGVVRFFFLPPIKLGGRLNLFRLAVYLGRFAFDLVVASFLVAGQALGPKIDSNAVVAIQLRTRSDFIMTLTATTVALVPGTFVLDVARAEGVLYIHVLAAKDDEAVELARLRALQIEERIIRAIGSHADLEKIRR